MTRFKHFTAGLIRKLWKLFPNDELYLKITYFCEQGQSLNLNNPVKFTEKLQWLKLYDRKQEYIKMVDKVKAKKHAKETIGEEYIIPTIGVWKSFHDIDFDKMPMQFVLKTNHGSGNHAVVICNNKSTFDKNSARIKLERSLKKNTYNKYREWPYKDIQPMIFAEEFIQPEDGCDLTDYKFFCFNGIPRYCQVIQNRSIHETIDFYDTNWVHQDFVGLNPHVQQSGKDIKCPENFNKMVDIAAQLSYNIPFVRVDLYNIRGQIYFGEITFYPASGYGRFYPTEWNDKLGALIDLPINKKS